MEDEPPSLPNDTTSPSPASKIPPAVGRKLRLAQAVLFWEDFWRLAWAWPALAALFASLVLFDLLPSLPGWLHVAVLAAFAAAIVIAAKPLRDLVWPSRPRAARRLEMDSGLAHRPLQGRDDSLAGRRDDPLTVTLWQAQQERLARILLSLRLKPPRIGLSRRDPWGAGLRLAPLVLLIAALATGFHDVGGKIERAFAPLVPGEAPFPQKLQVWLTPPAYTNMPPLLLETQPGKPLPSIPRGSSLLALLQGGPGVARLSFTHENTLFQPVDKASQRIEMKIATAGMLRIRQGHRQIGAWNIELMAEHPPVVAILQTEGSETDGRLRLDLALHDDFGIARAGAVVRLMDPDKDGAPLDLPLPIAPTRSDTAQQSVWLDLAASPWAGQTVSIEPWAENVAGVRAKGEAVTATLPERRFTDPQARAVIELRQRLIAVPEQKRPVVEGLADIIAQPDRVHGDTIAYLAISTAISRLIHGRDEEAAIASVIDILWQAALRIEEGGLPDAQHQLDAAAQALEQALDSEASGAEIERLTQQLDEAMQNYLQALSDLAERQGLSSAELPPDSNMLSEDDIAGMLGEMQTLAQTGSRDAARQMLQSLRQMMDDLRAGLKGAPTGEQAAGMQKVMAELHAVAEEQQKLLDESFRANQAAPEDGATKPKAPGKGGKDGAKGVARQEENRNRLGKAMQSLAELGVDIPDNLGTAEQAMRGAIHALGQGDLGNAIEAQAQALDALRQGNQQAMQGMGQRMGGGIFRRSGAGGRDPLGRAMRGNINPNDNSVKIPNQADVQKAREVLDEIRRRSGETERPAPERDYLQRLLKQMF